ncbi:prelamin-A/C-like isoform X2 [Amphiura filiformis]|uniref:prelamin-A/C-like isoform X2 n=1 Tax=Amphiura filiformis TaxID=82378 RepID=UPI003B217C52
MATPTQQRVSQRTTRSEYTVRSKSSTPQTPLSPTKITRVQEKEDLQDLNDRLATYIDKVRNLELENSRLIVQVTTIEESHTKELSNLKALYERELSDARRLLDETAKDKARLQIEVGKYKSQVDELKPRLSSLEKELDAANKRVLVLESSLGEKEGRIKSLFSEKRQLEDQLEKLKKKLADKEKQLNVAKKQVEEETVLRVDLENRLQSLKEELAFKDSLYKEELKEARSKVQIDLTEIDNRNKEEYEGKLLEALRDMREQHEYQITVLRQETETLYSSKLKDLKNTVERYRNQATTAVDDLRQFRSKYDSLESEVSTLRAQNEALIARIKDLERQLRKEQDDHQKAMEDRDRELQDLREVMAEQLKEYEDLMNVKLSLDMEIEAYRKLLEGEENRLNITPSPKRGKTTPRSGKKIAKRRRVEDTASTTASSSSTGLVAITEVNTDGEYIKLQNNSDEDQAMGGWHLKQQVDDAEEAKYKFTAKFVLKAGKEVTVWASGSGHSHSPPNHLVFKNQNSWGTGEKIDTTLVDASEEVMATRQVSRDREVTYEETDSGLREGQDKDKSCRIM